jgi:hypothetical protein
MRRDLAPALRPPASAFDPRAKSSEPPLVGAVLDRKLALNALPPKHCQEARIASD